MRLCADVMSRVEDPFFARALELAERARGQTVPNPLVGCVVVRDGRVVGEGFHTRAGGPHAEVVALADAGSEARSADVYVTLEPCAHKGRTGPCTETLVEAGVARVFVGMRDPNPESHGGTARLRDAGVEVAFAENIEPFAALNEGWLKRLATGLPFVTAKIGMSLDSRVAFSAGKRARVTGDSGAEVTRRLRSVVDAVLVSAATVDSDDPLLTVRRQDESCVERQPLRVVLARNRMPRPTARVFTTATEAAPTLLLASERVSADSLPERVKVERWDSEGGLAAVLRVLGALGISELLIEPGPRLLTALWEGEALDQLVTVTAGGMAGVQAPSLYSGGPDCEGGTLRPRMRATESDIVGDVSVAAWRPIDRAGD